MDGVKIGKFRMSDNTVSIEKRGNQEAEELCKLKNQRPGKAHRERRDG